MAKAEQHVTHSHSTRNDDAPNGAERRILHTAPISPTAELWRQIARAEAELDAIDPNDEVRIEGAITKLDKLWFETACHEAEDFADVLRQLMAARQQLDFLDLAEVTEAQLRRIEYHLDAAVRGITRFTHITPISLATALGKSQAPTDQPASAG